MCAVRASEAELGSQILERSGHIRRSKINDEVEILSSVAPSEKVAYDIRRENHKHYSLMVDESRSWARPSKSRRLKMSQDLSPKPFGNNVKLHRLFD
jgi:hypothetical protein